MFNPDRGVFDLRVRARAFGDGFTDGDLERYVSRDGVLGAGV